MRFRAARLHPEQRRQTQPTQAGAPVRARHSTSRPVPRWWAVAAMSARRDERKTRPRRRSRPGAQAAPGTSTAPPPNPSHANSRPGKSALANAGLPNSGYPHSLVCRPACQARDAASSSPGRHRSMALLGAVRRAAAIRARPDLARPSPCSRRCRQGHSRHDVPATCKREKWSQLRNRTRAARQKWEGAIAFFRLNSSRPLPLPASHDLMRLGGRSAEAGGHRTQNL